MEKLKEILEQPWPWYVSGPLLGMIVPILLVLSNKQFGVSSSFQHFCAAAGLRVKDYFSYDWRKQGGWQLLFVLGLLLAGLGLLFLIQVKPSVLSIQILSAFKEKGIAVSGFFPVQFFSGGRVWVLILGGLLIGFGSRYAGGCTGGHAIMGVSLFAKSSILSLIGFFIGGIIGTYLLLEIIL